MTGWRLRALVAALMFAGAIAYGSRPAASTHGPLREAPSAITASPGDPLTIKIGLARAGGYHVVDMPLEAYVAGVLAGEAAPDSGPAALQALAITIRTYAMANLGRHRAQGFDLCDQTHCQVYRAPTAIMQEAARATAGEILTYQNKPASVYFSASCGGYSERPSEVWPGANDPPYLPSKPDPACARQPAWSATVKTAELERALHTAGFRGHLRHLRAAGRDESGRVTTLRLEGLSPSTISGQDLRMAVGATVLKSTAFTLKPVHDGYQIDGRGFGHGVGLCEVGAAQMAAHGRSAADILAAYFPGTAIAPLNTGTTAASSAPQDRPRAATPATPPCSKGRLRPRPYPGGRTGCGPF